MLYVLQLQSLYHTVKQYIGNAFCFSYFNMQNLTDQHKVYNVQEVIVTTRDISDLADISDNDSDKDMSYIPPAIRDNFDDDSNEYDTSGDKTSELMQIYYNSIGVENDESLVTPKTCAKTETQATKKHAFCWIKKDPPAFEKHYE